MIRRSSVRCGSAFRSRPYTSFVPALGFVAVLTQDGQPDWLLAGIAVGVGVVGRPAFVFCRDEFRASRVRKTRGIPRPARGKEVVLPDADLPGTAHIDLKKRPEDELSG